MNAKPGCSSDSGRGGKGESDERGTLSQVKILLNHRHNRHHRCHHRRHCHHQLLLRMAIEQFLGRTEQEIKKTVIAKAP